jgi:hypothetical protein
MPTPSIAELWDREIARKAERKAAKAKASPAKSSSQPEATGLTPARVPPRLASPAKRGRFVAPIAAPVPSRPAETTALVPSSSRPMAPARPAPSKPLTRPMPIVPAAPVARAAAEPKAGQKTLRAAARAVLQAWEDGDLADAVRDLEFALGEGGTPKQRAVLRNLFHPTSYRKEYAVTLTGDDLRRLQLLTNAASLAGPIGLTTYAIKPEEMEWARGLLAKIRETA